MLVVTKFDVPDMDGAAFLPRAQAALAAFASCPGYLRGRIARSADDPTVWLLTTEWSGVGAYRRSLGSYDVKVEAAPLLSLGRDEPSAFEILHADDVAAQPVTNPSRRARDAEQVDIGSASGPAAVEP